MYSAIQAFTDYILFGVCICLLMGSIYISIKLRFIQIRFLPNLFKMLYKSLIKRDYKDSPYTILPHQALFTAMSTTIGVGTIVGPVIAIYWGGPGALLGFVLTALFGSAATYLEVNLCIRYRKKLPSGEVIGGPMHYLKEILSKKVARWYAFCCFLLMTVWSAAQANQLSAILDSPLLGDYRIPTAISGVLIAAFIMLILVGGIKRIGSFSSKLVPLMFILYLGASFWIFFSNIEKLPSILYEIFVSSFTPTALGSGVVVGGVVSALRWGIFKGVQATEAGVGTQTIPHSMAETNDPNAQGTLAMCSTYMAGFIAFLSGCVTLMTGTWQDSTYPLGISMVAGSFHQYFSSTGVFIVAVSAILFVFGTILGNSFNGSQCFAYLLGTRKIPVYYGFTALMIFIGSISEVTVVWSLIDIALAFMAIPHIGALMLYATQHAKEVEVKNLTTKLAS